MLPTLGKIKYSGGIDVGGDNGDKLCRFHKAKLSFQKSCQNLKNVLVKAFPVGKTTISMLKFHF